MAQMIYFIFDDRLTCRCIISKIKMDVSVFSVVLLTVFLGPGHGYGNHEEANRGTSKIQLHTVRLPLLA